MTATAELPIEGALPDLGGATRWLNSEPLTPAGLRGKVVVIQFCTFSCVNWLRTVPYYTEPKRLAKLDYLSARKEPGKTRERTVYTLTDKGLQALRDYARTPVPFTPLKSEPLIRLLICDLVGEEITRESLATLRDDIADIQLRLDDSERSATQLPHREKYLQLVNGFLRRLLELHLELVDEVERELPGEAVTAPPGSAEALG